MGSELHIILGNSGSGKTTRLYEMLTKEAQKNLNDNYFLVVPEQFTLQAQKDIVEKTKGNGTLNIDIVSFARLGYRIFNELDTDIKTVLEDHGKSMMLRKVLGEVNDELSVYKNMKDKDGFIDQAKSVLSEFYQYEIHEGELDELIKAAEDDDFLSCKLNDIYIIYKSFTKALGTRYSVSEQLLDILCEVSEQSGLLKNAAFYFDGYTGFTPNQYKLISCLMRLGKKCVFTITMDKQSFYGKKYIKDVFSLSRDTLLRLNKCRSELGEASEVSYTTLFEPEKVRYKGKADLAFLEASLFRRHKRQYGDEVENIFLWQAKSTRTEVHGVANEICRLVREQGLRYREIGVISANEEEYKDLCDHIFSQYDIPHFMDQTNKVLNHPYVESLRAALAICCKGDGGFTYDRIMRYLNTGVCGISRSEAEELDNYILATNTVGLHMWQNGFKRLPKSYWLREKNKKKRDEQRRKQKEYIKEINNIRKKVINNLMPLYQAIRYGRNVHDKMVAIYKYMVTNKYEQKLSLKADDYENDGDYVMARTWRSIYPAIIELLDKCNDILGEEENISNQELCSILDAGLSEFSIGAVPATMDQVIVGDIMRTRLNTVKVLFILGVNDNNLPVNSASPNLLSDQDRLKLEGSGIELAPNYKDSAYDEQFYLYLALTKPSQRLYVSCARVDSSGGSLRPAYLISTLLRIFPKLKTESREQEIYLVNEQTIYPYLVNKSREYIRMGKLQDADTFFALYNLCKKEKAYRNILVRMQQGYSYKNTEEPIARELAVRLFGEKLYASITRLERYAGCAFSHFLQYGLKLKERERYTFQSMDFGNILHRIMELFGRNMKLKGIEYSKLTDKEIAQYTMEAVEQALDEEGYDELSEEGARSAYMLNTVDRMAKRTIKVICRHLQLGDFVPQEFELSFGAGGDIDGPVYQIGENVKMELMGVIDRLDLFRDTSELPNKVYLKILDYKTGNNTLDLTKVYYGLQLQLLTYMMVAKKYYPQNGERVAAAALYYHIQDPVMDYDRTLYGVEEEEQRKELLDKVQQETKKNFCMNGLLSSEEAVLSHLEHHPEGAYQYESVSVKTKKDGGLYANSKCNSSKELDMLISHTESEIVRLGTSMLSGDVGISPYIYKNSASCEYCQYKEVCHVDLKKNENARILTVKDINDFKAGDTE